MQCVCVCVCVCVQVVQVALTRMQDDEEVEDEEPTPLPEDGQYSSCIYTVTPRFIYPPLALCVSHILL